MFHLSNGRNGENEPAAVAPKAESIPAPAPAPAPVSVPASVPAADPIPAPAAVLAQTLASEPLPTQTSTPVDGFDEFDPRGSFSGNTFRPVLVTTDLLVQVPISTGLGLGDILKSP